MRNTSEERKVSGEYSISLIPGVKSGKQVLSPLVFSPGWKEDHLGEQETCPLPIGFKWKGKMAFPANRAIFLDFSQDLWPAYSLYSHCIALLTVGLIHSFHEQPLYLTPHSPKAQLSDLAHNSASWLLSYWIKGFCLQDLSAMPAVTCALLLSGAGSTATCRESSARQISQHWFSVFHKKCLLNKVNFISEYCQCCLSFFINTGWQIDLTFACEFRVVTCYLTFCLEHGSLQNKRSVLPKCHFNQRWL